MAMLLWQTFLSYRIMFLFYSLKHVDNDIEEKIKLFLLFPNVNFTFYFYFFFCCFFPNLFMEKMKHCVYRFPQRFSWKKCWDKIFIALIAAKNDRHPKKHCRKKYTCYIRYKQASNYGE